MTLSPKRAEIGMATMVSKPKRRGELGEVALRMSTKRSLVEADEVDLVDREHDVADAEQRDDVGVAAGLGEDAVLGVDEEDGEIGGRGAGRHVARVLLVAGRVGDDEAAPVGGEIAVGDVDGDALLALGDEAVDEEREIDLAAGRCRSVAESDLSAASWSSNRRLES